MVKNPPANAREPGSIPAWGKSLGEENGNPLEYSCRGNEEDKICEPSRRDTVISASLAALRVMDGRSTPTSGPGTLWGRSLSSYYVSVTVVSTLNVSYVIEGASQMVQW